MLHTFVALVEDKPGVLTRVASLFRRLNINIVSLTVGHSERPDISRMTIVADARPGRPSHSRQPLQARQRAARWTTSASSPAWAASWR